VLRASIEVDVQAKTRWVEATVEDLE